jgi:hypothetical protein
LIEQRGQRIFLDTPNAIGTQFYWYTKASISVYASTYTIMPLQHDHSVAGPL